MESVENHPVQGYILSNGLDTYGRTIAFVFTGGHPAVDDSQIFVTTGMLDASLNTFMLRQGHAYAAFYLTLPVELREYLRSIARNVVLTPGMLSSRTHRGESIHCLATCRTLNP